MRAAEVNLFCFHSGLENLASPLKKTFPWSASLLDVAGVSSQDCQWYMHFLYFRPGQPLGILLGIYLIQGFHPLESLKSISEASLSHVSPSNTGT